MSHSFPLLDLPNGYTWHYALWSQLTVEQHYQIMSIRQKVFIIEQHCFYLDADGIDLDCMHALICDTKGQIVAYARCYQHQQAYPGAQHPSYIPKVLYETMSHYGEQVWWIGRVLVVAEQRKQGWATRLMHAIHQTLRHHQASSVCVSAQAYLQDFYRGLGYYAIGDLYQDAGIDHICMMQTFEGVLTQAPLPIHHLIFDFDGTLFDSSVFYIECFQKLAHILSEPAPSVEDLQATMHAGLYPQLAVFLSHRLEQEYDEILEHFRVICLQHTARCEQIYSHVPLLLSQLKACGYQLHICTNSPQDLCTQHIHNLSLHPYITQLVGGDRGLERKPSTDMLIHLLNLLDISAQQSVLIGDSRVDIQASSKIQMSSVAVHWGFTDHTALQSASYQVDEVYELLTLFLTQYAGEFTHEK